MILLKNTGSDYFEEAYFIISDAADQRSGTPHSENDMIREANRIISETFVTDPPFCRNAYRSRRLTGSRRFWYLAGILCGAALTVIFDFCFLH